MSVVANPNPDFKSNMAIGSHMVGKNVKAIPKIPRQGVDLTSRSTPKGSIAGLNVPLEYDTQNVGNSDGINIHKVKGSDQYFTDILVQGSRPFGGLESLNGYGKLSEGLANYPKEKAGFQVPNPTESYELKRRVPLKGKIAKEYICDTVNDGVLSSLNSEDIVNSLVRSHQKGYKKTKVGTHGANIIVQNTKWLDNNKPTGTFKGALSTYNEIGDEFLMEGTEYATGYQGDSSHNGFGDPTDAMDGPAIILRKVVDESNTTRVVNTIMSGRGNYESGRYSGRLRFAPKLMH